MRTAKILIAGVVAGGFLLAPAAAPAFADPTGDATTALNNAEATATADQGTTLDLTMPDISLAGLDGTTPCTATITPTVTFYRGSTSPTMRETATSAAKTNCRGGITAVAQVVDVAPDKPTYATKTSGTNTTYSGGSVAAKSTATQYVSYFTGSVNATSVSTRPASLVTMQFAANNRYASTCLEYQFTIVDGSKIQPLGVQSC